jgi:hypothetical protein
LTIARGSTASLPNQSSWQRSKGKRSRQPKACTSSLPIESHLLRTATKSAQSWLVLRSINQRHQNKNRRSPVLASLPKCCTSLKLSRCAPLTMQRIRRRAIRLPCLVGRFCRASNELQRPSKITKVGRKMILLKLSNAPRKAQPRLKSKRQNQ